MPENQPGASTTSYSVERAHSRSEGIVVLPIAGPPPQTPSFVRIHAPIEFESIYWSASRDGAPPVCPTWNSFATGSNRVFLGGQRTGVVATPILGGHNFTVAGVYHYAIGNPEGLDSTFLLGRMPWETNLTPDFNCIPAGNFVTGIICPTTDLQLQTPIPRY